MTEFLKSKGPNILARLYVRNYRSIEEIELRLSPLTVQRLLHAVNFWVSGQGGQVSPS